MKKILLGFGMATVLFTTSCSNDPKSGGDAMSTPASSETTITDVKLYPFMLGSVYFFHGYGGANEFMEKMVEGQMSSKPGDKDFTTDLHRIYTEYFYYPFKTEDGAGARQMLSSAWDMGDKAAYQKGMEELINSGHQAVYQRLSADGAKPQEGEDKERLDFITTHKSEFPKGGIKAWDIARYVNNTAMGYSAGYITKEEGDAMLAKLPAIAQASYTSWADYWNGYNLGRQFWGGDKENDASFDKDVKDMQQGDYSLYKYMKW
jgi:hypothetical protein